MRDTRLRAGVETIRGVLRPAPAERWPAWPILGLAGVLAGGVALVSPAAAVGVALAIAGGFAVSWNYSWARGSAPSQTRPRGTSTTRAPQAEGKDRVLEASAVDPAVVLIAAGVLHDRPRAADTVIDGDFARAWGTRAARHLHGDPADVPASLASAVGLPGSSLELVAIADQVTALHGTERLGTWESPVALCLDVAALELLPERVQEWDRLTVAARSEVVGALRLFVERCPDCGGAVVLETGTGFADGAGTCVDVRCHCCHATIQSLAGGTDGSGSGDHHVVRYP